MGVGIGASLITEVANTLAKSSDMNSNLTAINNAGISNDSGVISTNGSGTMTLPGIIVGNAGLSTNSTGLANLAAKSQSVSGDTSGTMTVYETFAGTLKVVILSQQNYKHAGSAQLVTLNTAFTFVGGIFNFGTGGVVVATGGTVANLNAMAWGTGGGQGSIVSQNQCPQWSAAYSQSGFAQIGSIGGYATAHTGVAIYIGL
jgi:hypothetical protein